jgi:alpha-L-fucosidase
VKSVDRLFTIYTQSVGRNSKLLLNVPPTPDGLLHQTDVDRLTGLRARLDAEFSEDLCAGQPVRRGRGSQANLIVEVALKQRSILRWLRLREDIAQGQRVAQYEVLAADRDGLIPIAAGTTIGHTKIDRVIEPRPVSRVVVRILDNERSLTPITVQAFGDSQ